MNKLNQIKLFNPFQLKNNNFSDFFLQENMKIYINDILSFQTKLCFVLSFIKKIFEKELFFSIESNFDKSKQFQSTKDNSVSSSYSFDKTRIVLDLFIDKQTNKFSDQFLISENAQNYILLKKIFAESK